MVVQEKGEIAFEVRKHNKRLKIFQGDKIVYTPPDFIRHKISNRDVLMQLADKLNEKGNRDISEIIDFEAKFTVDSHKKRCKVCV